ncbi:hypothetical protein OUZ56_032566 [Daphnia magna]|uniref:Uncharacterized protein n=1 Tax=Daphnia magna TaxID=35525 RepID=A0ABR0B9A5_9CRUS|nr:hypothetical protein OUZ56_032566 [Daphnia magna]
MVRLECNRKQFQEFFVRTGHADADVRLRLWRPCPKEAAQLADLRDYVLVGLPLDDENAVRSSTHLKSIFGRESELPGIESGRLWLAAFDPLDRNVGIGSQTRHGFEGIAAMRRRKDLDVEALEAGIDFIDQQYAASRAGEAQREAQEAPDPVPEIANRHGRGVVEAHNHAARPAVFAQRNVRDATNAAIERLERRHDVVVLLRQGDRPEEQSHVVHAHTGCCQERRRLRDRGTPNSATVEHVERQRAVVIGGDVDPRLRPPHREDRRQLFVGSKGTKERHLASDFADGIEAALGPCRVAARDSNLLLGIAVAKKERRVKRRAGRE